MAAPSSPNDPSTDPTPGDLIAARPWLRYDPMAGLLMDGVPLAAIADAIGTPTWVYSAATMRARYRALAGRDDRCRTSTCRCITPSRPTTAGRSWRCSAAEGAGADVVSGGELLKARKAGIPASRIVYSGVGKSEQELRLALAEDIGQINVESAEELAMLCCHRRSPSAAGPASRCGSTPTSTPAPTTRSPPAGPTTSSAFPTPMPPPSIARAASMPGDRAHRPCHAYRQPDPGARAVSRRLRPHRRSRRWRCGKRGCG